MPKPSRDGFTLVEAVVATAMMSVAGGLLATGLTVVTVARRRADIDAWGAQALREHVSLLAGRSCALPDTGAVDRLGEATDRWSARRSGGTWVFVDSVSVPGAPPRAAMGGIVLCP